MIKRKTEHDDGLILDHLRRCQIKRVCYQVQATAQPQEYTPAYLDHLNEYALEIELGHPAAPVIKRDGDRFVLERPERKRTRYKTIRRVLRKLIFELAMKNSATY